MARPCLQWPDVRLRTPAEPVRSVTDEIRAIWTDMNDTMLAMPGVGLAAPQIGVMLRLAIVNATGQPDQTIRLANPEIVSASAELRAHDEGSPNLPGVSARLERPREVTVRYLNVAGDQTERVFQDLEATSVQHQIDHLNGRMYFDALSPLKRRMLLKKAQKQR